MKTIYLILVVSLLAIFTNNFVSAQRVTSIYSGDLNAEKYQEKLNIIDLQISQLELKKATELREVKKSERRNKKDAYKLSTYTGADSTKIVSPREAVCLKYDTLITELNRQKLELTDAMVNSKGNYISSNTSAEKAAILYPAIKYADNIGNVASNPSTVNVNNPAINTQTVMLYVHNESRNTVTITSIPFAGITLTPGQKSTVALSIPTGNYLLSYTEYYTGSNRTFSRSINIPISVNGGTDINIR